MTICNGNLINGCDYMRLLKNINIRSWLTCTDRGARGGGCHRGIYPCVHSSSPTGIDI